MDDAGFDYRVYGRVQGVGFRFFVQRAAAELELRGWVKNMPDGSVAIRAFGTAAAIVEFRRRIGVGPSASQVTEVDARPLDPLVAAALLPFKVTY